MVKSHAGRQSTRLVISEQSHGPLRIPAHIQSGLDLVIDEITDADTFPLTLQNE